MNIPTLLPDRVKARLDDGTSPPIISEYECYVKLKAAKKPKSVIPGDLPSKIVTEFMEELASPLHKLLNNITQSAVWPKQYKIEHFCMPFPTKSNVISDVINKC